MTSHLRLTNKMILLWILRFHLTRLAFSSRPENSKFVHILQELNDEQEEKGILNKRIDEAQVLLKVKDDRINKLENEFSDNTWTQKQTNLCFKDSRTINQDRPIEFRKATRNFLQWATIE